VTGPALAAHLVVHEGDELQVGAINEKDQDVLRHAVAVLSARVQGEGLGKPGGRGN